MGGTHKFTSSIWIQSGSGPATFQSGITASTVTATIFVGDGSGLTGLDTAVFFAGSGSGISASNPSSIDHVTKLDASTATAPAGYFRIETTSSAEFKPNHFVFIKLTDKFETLQAGPQNFYVGEDRVVDGDASGLNAFDNDLAPGVHRYIVYATNTGSAGATHAVYTSTFIEGYVNVPPVIETPDQSLGVVQIGHDKNSLTHILHFTESREPNSSQNDFIRIFSASRLDGNVTELNATDATYTLTMTHAQDNISEVNGLIATGSNDTEYPYDEVPGAGPNASALPLSVLAFTASINNYNTIDGSTNHSDTVQPSEQSFKITMFDNWYVAHSSSVDYSMSIIPPNTASIRNVRARIESGSFTGVTTDTFSTPILYDDPGTTRTSRDGLNDRYTASLVRVSVMADITEPDDYSASGTHFTDILIAEDGDTNKPLRNKTFRFSGSTATGLFRSTASHYDGGTDFVFTNATESLGFSPFSYTAGTSTLYVSETDDINYLRHGDHNHISAMQKASNTTLTVRPVPNIEISNVRVEVESGSFLTGVGAFERSASILYGYTSSLRVAETSSLEEYEKSAEYISESVIRLRLSATVTEPFGPHHTKMTSSITTTDESSYSYNHTFEFYTSSIDTASAVIGYDNQNRLVGNYTSSWINFNLLAGNYVFSASFNSSTNAGRTIIPGTYAEVTVSNTPATQITNIVYETETAGYSETGSRDALRTVLYGVPRHTLVDSSSFRTHVSASIYASHSVSRFRVKATITEPFGPHHTASMFEKVWTNSSDSQDFKSVIHFSTGSTDTASSAIGYDNQNRLVGHYTSSWIGRQLSSSDNASKTWTYTSGSITHTPNDLSGFTTASGLSTQLVVHDTDQIQLTNRIIEFEEHGYSASNTVGSTGVTETSRTVLYGDNHHILGSSSSFDGHVRADQYASQSVLRYRVKFKVTEPVGPAVGTIQIPIQRGINPSYPTKTAHTGSSDFLFISSVYDSQERLVTDYTSSWQSGKNNELGELNRGGSEDFIYQVKDADVTSSLESQSENGINKTTQQPGTVTVHDTVPTQITNIRYQTETFGYSNEPSTETTRKVLYGVAHKTNIDSSSYASHASASLYASQSVTQFRVLATITEPVGPLHTSSRFEKAWTSALQSPLLNTIHFNTASTDTASSAIAYDLSNRLVGHYTSSWVGIELSSNDFITGETWTYTSGSILHEPEGENRFTTSSGESSEVTIFDTQPTVFSNFKTETETYGYSNEPTQSTVRTVLYGVAHKTVETSQSFANHANSGSYASQSVSRFRIVTTITEPVGPLHLPSVIEKIFHYGDTPAPSKTETITFSTASIGFESSRSFFTEVGEFVTEYTTSFEGKELDVQEGALQERVWSISTGSVTHNPDGENSANSSSFTATSLKVCNTDTVKIEKIFWETETYGYSNEETSQGLRTILYGNARVTDIDSSSYAEHLNSGSYASHSVSRIRFRARITEPAGPAVNAFSASFIHGDTTSTFGMHTGSIQDGGNISFSYIDNRLVTHYTSSYIGHEFDTDPGSQKTHNLNGTFTDLTSGENGLIESNETTGQIIVRDTEPTQIDNIFYETETFGYSGEPSTDTTRTVLYGDIQVTNTGTGSGDSGNSWSSHASASLYASHSVTRFRIRARITEPVGPLHTASRFEKVWSTTNRSFSDVIHFSTASGDITASSVIAYDNQDRLVATYTSQWIGRGLSSSIFREDEEGLLSGETYTYTSGSISHEPEGENACTTASGESTTITVFDTYPTQFTNITFETETFGYSGEPSTNTIRKVLYGVPHHTIADTSSLYWKDHDSASLYASQSVTRFRISATVTEPIGPLHTGSIIQQQFASSKAHESEITDTVPSNALAVSEQLFGGDVLNAFDTYETGTGYTCLDPEVLTITFNEPQLITRIEILSEGASSPIVEASAYGNPAWITVPDIISEDGIVPERSYRYYRITFNNPGELSISNIRFFTTTFTEPRLFNNTTFKLNTIGDVETSASGYDAQSRLVAHYTSSWFGAQLSSSKQLGVQYFGGPITDGEQWQYTLSNIIHNPGDLSLIKQPENPAAANVEVYDTADPQYVNFDIESETFGYSDVPASMIRRTILYGNTTTDIDSSSYADHVSASLYASHSVTRVRATTQIIEPVGPLIHTASNIEVQYTNFDDFSSAPTIDNIVFGTGSDTFVRSYWTPTGEFVAEYTSSYVGKAFPPSANGWSSGVTVTHQYPGENFSAPSYTGLTLRVNDTEPTQIDSIAYETETAGHSGIASTDTARKVLYGDTGTTNVDSQSFATHPNSGSYASESVSQFRVRARIIEPVGPLHTASRFDRIWRADGEASITDTLHFSTASNNAISKSYSDETGRFIVEYTTSFAGKALAAPNATERVWTYTSGSILHEPEGENRFTTSSGDSSTITVTGTPQTQIRNIRVETETVGHSNVGVQNTSAADHRFISRSILYGETVSFANSASFEGRDPIFAESSVTRFRILADITEPIGPHHTGSLFAYTKDVAINDGAGYDSSETVPTGEGTSDFIIFSTASNQIAYSESVYNAETKELEAAYTSSWFGETLSPSRVLRDGYWHIDIDDTNVRHTPIDESGVTKDTSGADLYMVVSASKPLEVSTRIVVETFYSSSVDTNTLNNLDVLYGYERTLSASDANTIGDIWSGSAAVRFRPYVQITEPLGFRHFTTEITMSTSDASPEQKSRAYKFHTASLETASRSDRVLNSEGRFITVYTGSYEDEFTFGLDGQQSATYAIIVQSGGARTGSDVTGVYMDNDGIDMSYNGASLILNRPYVTAITNIRVEAETVSGSAVGTDNRTTTILHGNTVTEIDKEDNAGYPTETARQQLTSIRVLADIAEPFGPHHTASRLTVTGYGGTHTVTLHTGSADVVSSVQELYQNHGSQSVSYTSSFVPLQLEQGTINTTVNKAEHMYSFNGGYEDARSANSAGGLGGQPHATITVLDAPTASVFVTPQTGSQFFSSSAGLPKYVTYNNEEDLVVGIISGISASAPPETSESILTFPQHLNIRYDDNGTGLPFTTVNATVSGQETGSLTIANSLMDDLTNVTTYTVNVSGSDILPGSGSSGNQPLTFQVIPAKPQHMHEMFWGPAGTSIFHKIASDGIDIPLENAQGTLYKGTLAGGDIGRKDGENAGDEVTNIIMAKTSGNGSTDYAITFNTFTPSTTGNYGDNDRLFDRGDEGSLIVRINGQKVVDANLAANFKTVDKTGDQELGNYDDGGFANGEAFFTDEYLTGEWTSLAGKGKVVLTKVTPFNNVHHDIYNAGKHYPNGYQGWSARIELTDKLNDSYNKLEFSHSFSDGTSQNWEPFDWYYDDHITLAATNPSAVAAYSMPDSEPTFSRSGVSFFKTGQGVDININDIATGIAGDTYAYDSEQIMQTELGTGLEFEESAANVTHHLSSEANANGLSFPDPNPLTPDRDAVADLNMTLTATSATAGEHGDTKSIVVKQFNRDYNHNQNFVVDGSGTTIQLGRFAEEPTTVSTDTTEHFFTEDLRWQRDTMETNANTNQLGTGYDAPNSPASGIKENFLYWTDTTKTDYNSNIALNVLSELQISNLGHLMYPSLAYSGLPNTRDYDGLTGDKYFYRAFNVFTNAGQNANQFAFIIYYGSNTAITATDIFAEDPEGFGTVDVDSLPLRIDIKFPGATGNGQGAAAPGSGWGSIGGGDTSTSSPGGDNWTAGSAGADDEPEINFVTAGNSLTKGGSTRTCPANAVMIFMKTGAYGSKLTKGIVLVRVRMRAENPDGTPFTKKITQLDVEEF